MAPAAASAMAPSDWTADRAALDALVSAELADHHGDSGRSLAEWQRLARLVPDLPDLNEHILEQAIAAGDMAAAQKAALVLWNDENFILDERIILIAGAVRRSDWKSAERFSNEGLNDVQLLQWDRMFGPILGGWISVGRKDRAGVSAALGRTVESLHPAIQAHGAMMYLALGDKATAEPLAARLRPTDRTSQFAAIQLATEMQAAGLSKAADQLRSHIRLLAQPVAEPLLFLPAARVSTPRAGIGHWFSAMAESFASLNNAAATPRTSLARAAAYLNSEDWAARLLLAQEAVSLNKADEALTLLSSKGDLPPIILLHRAEIFLEKGDEQAAIAEADGAILAADTPRALLIMHADVVRKTQNKGAADAAFQRLIEHLSQAGDEPALEALLLISLADLRMKDGRWEDVSPLMERAVSLAPENATVLNFVGYSAIERRIDLPTALARIAKASEKEPENASITDSLGWAYHLMGRHAEAVPLLEKAWQGEPTNAIIAEHLGDAYWIVGQKFEARYIWRTADFIADDVMKLRLQAKLANGLTNDNAAP